MRLVITGGGTGGHLFPGLAVARAVIGAHNDDEVLFISTSRVIDQKVLASEKFECATIGGSGIKGYGLLGILKSLLALPPAVLEAVRLLRRFRAEVVFAVGGYVTGPVVVAAKLLRIPVCIHEQNSVPGLTNRLAGRLADVICTSIPCDAYFSGSKAVQTGNPVRREILELAQKEIQGGKAHPVLLVLGGSQGAHRVNELVVEALGLLHEEGTAMSVIHQTGENDAAMVRKAYDQKGIESVVAPFIEDMAACYAQAEIAVSRAGATTLAELAVVGLPAVLIPYPYAADNHQLGNALYYKKKGGCEVFEQEKLDGTLLAGYIRRLLNEPERLAQMREGMLSAAMPHATEAIVNQCMQLTGKRG